MATFDYTPLIPTSIEAITITQTLTRLHASPITSTFTTATTLTLSKAPATGTGGSQGTSGPSHLSSSAIGAIVGSLLGVALILGLIYFCFRSPSDNEYSDSEGSLEPAGRIPQDKEPIKTTSGRIKLEKTEEDVLQQSRPARRRQTPRMNRAYAEPKAPIIPASAILWLAGQTRINE